MVDQNEVKRLEGKALEMRKKLLNLCGAYDGSVHIGGDLSMTDILTVLFQNEMNVDPTDIRKPDRDRFVLSKGHGAVCMYIAMAIRGFFDYDEIVRTYAKLDSAFGMHPCRVQLPALECSSGSLGQGLAMTIGMALSAKYRHENHRVFCMMGDGETCEGEVWESAMSASAFKLNNLIGIVDRNRQMMTSYTEESVHMEPYADKWRAFGWRVVEVDGNNIEEILKAFDYIRKNPVDAPTMLICNTVKGKGVDFMEKKIEWHLASLTAQEAQKAIDALDAAYQGK